MTLKSVLRALQEVFPQIDLRILRAVAIEYSDDVDTAVEFILSDVLPIITEPAETSNPYISLDAEQSLNVGDYSREDTNGANLLPCHNVIVEQKETLLPSEPKAESDINLSADNKSNAHSEPQSSVVMLVGNCSNVLGKNETSETKLEEVVSVPQTVAAKCDVLDADVQELCKTKLNGTLAASSDGCPTLSFRTVQNNLDLMECGTQIEKAMSSCISEYEEQLLGAFKDVAKIQDKCNFEANSTVSAAFTNAEETSSVHEISQAQHSKKSGELINIEDFQSDYEVQQLECLAETASVLLPLEKDNVSISDTLQTAIVATQGEIPNIDFLDSILLDAQNKKRTLVSALESTINMLKGVELHEERAEQAKREASVAGEDIFQEAEDLRQKINHAKITNEKKAEEIYSEKSTMAPEAMELQSRLINISDERQKSLSILEEICQTLGARLAHAKEEQAAAEQEKLKREDLAHKFFREQEDIMNSILQEAYCLQNEAEENTKLREFLMDRGRMLDILQEEIAVACESALSLKNRVYGCMPDNRPILSVTGTLVSLSNSLSEKTVLPKSDLHSPTSKSSIMIDKEATMNLPLEGDAANHHQDCSDDDWEMLEDKAELLN
ncbi:unnamed protein product [Musa acuminata var. zebrina]